MGSYFKKGDWNAICDRCGIEYKASQLKEEWTHLMVCEGCWDPRHPSEFQKIEPEDPSVPWARPESSFNYYVETTAPTIDDSGAYVLPGYIEEI